MQNLAGNERCDDFILKELDRARIEVVHGPRSNREVAASITGRLGQFVFTRAWYCWIAKGPMPLNVAELLYADSVGRTDIRVAGHCGCPPPEDPWLTYRTDDGKEAWPAEEEQKILDMNSRHSFMAESWESLKQGIVFAEDRSAAGRAFVESYHIDTEVGLRLFADTVRQHGLIQQESTIGSAA